MVKTVQTIPVIYKIMRGKRIATPDITGIYVF
jgi:hypothetical protein